MVYFGRAEAREGQYKRTAGPKYRPATTTTRQRNFPPETWELRDQPSVNENSDEKRAILKVPDHDFELLQLSGARKHVATAMRTKTSLCLKFFNSP